MGQTVIDNKIEAEIVAIAADVGCEVAYIEFQGNSLRVFLDRLEGGVTIDDCQAVSKQLSAYLDVQDFGRERYVLEVSSPGLDRKLVRPRDYERFGGHLLRVTFIDAKTGKKKTIVGTLDEFRSASGGEISVVETTSNERFEIALADIQVARLEIDL